MEVPAIVTKDEWQAVQAHLKSRNPKWTPPRAGNDARLTDTERYFVSEASVYRLLKAQDLIPSPAYITIKAADEFRDKTVRPNQLWQTDFTYRKVTGWGWFYLQQILDDYSRYVIAWRLCTTMRATMSQPPSKTH